MARGRKLAPVENASLYLLKIIDRPVWAKHHRRECEAIEKLLLENYTLRLKLEALKGE
jgi:hypothetical protein